MATEDFQRQDLTAEGSRRPGRRTGGSRRFKENSFRLKLSQELVEQKDSGLKWKGGVKRRVFLLAYFDFQMREIISDLYSDGNDPVERLRTDRMPRITNHTRVYAWPPSKNLDLRTHVP